MILRSAILSALLVAQPLANEDVLEPSVENEVAHALARAGLVQTPARELTRTERDLLQSYATNGLSVTAKAIRLVSSQQADGRWRSGTNDVTRAAVAILRGLVGVDESEAKPSTGTERQ